MPLSSKGKKLMKKFIDTYGNEKAKEVFYASKNKGTIEGVEEGVKGTASPEMQAMIDRTAVLKAKKERAALMKANKEKAKPVEDSTYYKMGVILAEWMSKKDLEQYKGRPSRQKKAGAQGVTPMSDKQKKNRELQAQSDSDEDLEL